MSAMTPAAGQLVHAVMGVDWHGWLFLLGVIAACWVLAVAVTGALFAGGSARSSQRDPAPVAADNAGPANPPASHTRNRRHV